MSFSSRAALVAVLSLNLTVSAIAADGIRLSTVAADSGYTYQWLASEGGVTLQRAGVVIVLHAGYPMYEVNATPMQADSAPRFEGGDLIVSRALADRLRRIAIAHPQAIPLTAIHSSAIPLPAAVAANSSVSTSSALTINARQIPGREALTISGTAPANATVTVTLTADLSKDLPVVLLSRNTIVSASDGSYSFVAIIDQNAHRGTTITATAASFTGVTPVTARISVEAPSPQVNSILDGFPPK